MSLDQESPRWTDNLRNAFPPRPTEVPEQPEYGFFTDTTLCIGCKACEVACKQWNQLPSDGLTFTGHSYDNTQALSETTWRHVAFNEQVVDGTVRWLMMSDVCKHCEQAPCEQSCPTGSIVYNDFGDVYVQKDICNGCGYCVAACPFGVLGRSKEDGHAHKCTLCFDRQKGDLEPACAKVCPTDSIVFGPLAELREKARDRVETLQARGNSDAYLYGADSLGDYGRLGAFFLLQDHPNAYNLPEKPRQPFRGQVGRYLAGVAASAALFGLTRLFMRDAARIHR
jgi:formate dehydrogenase iron-sulfur subunit